MGTGKGENNPGKKDRRQIGFAEKLLILLGCWVVFRLCWLLYQLTGR